VISLAWVCARHAAVVEIYSKKLEESLQDSHGRISRGSSKRTHSTNDIDDQLDGHFQIGKLIYNSNEVLGKGCEGTKVFK
jgi:hypothetical protein